MDEMNSNWMLCMRSKAWNTRRLGLLILSFFILAWAIVVSIYISITETGTVVTVAVVGILVFGVLQFLYFSLLYVIEGRKYHLNETGITILYHGGVRKFYPWTSFKNIMICDFDHATKAPSNCFLIIRLSTFEEPYGPCSKRQRYTLSGLESWRGYHYTVRNFTKILFFEYSPALLDEIVNKSKLHAVFLLTKYGNEKMKSYSGDAKHEL